MDQKDSQDSFRFNSEDVLEQLFDELFREYEHRLYLFAFKMLKSDAIAKDVIQDVFLKLWLIRYRLSEIENISSFLHKLVENRVVDYLRSAAGDRRKKEELWQKMVETNDSSSEDHLVKKEFHIIIQRAIEHLPAQRKAVYVLSKTEGRRRKEVASLLNISPNTVRNQLAKAVESIANYVKRHSVW